MYAVNVNGTSSYRHCVQHEARQLIAGMSEEEKQRILDEIQLHRGAHNLMGQQYDTKMFHYIEKLLTEGSK